MKIFNKISDLIKLIFARFINEITTYHFPYIVYKQASFIINKINAFEFIIFLRYVIIETIIKIIYLILNALVIDIIKHI